MQSTLTENKWIDLFRTKTTTAEKAIQAVQSGHSVQTGHATTEALTLVNELVRQKDRLKNVKILHMNPIGNCDYLKSGMEQHFRANIIFANAPVREAINKGLADFTPIFLFEVPEIFRSGKLLVDVTFIHVSRPNETGYCSYGANSGINEALSATAKIVIAEVNDQMPYTEGTKIHIKDIDYLVETSCPLMELHPAPLDEVSMRIGKNIASLVEDRSNLQLGFGSIPDAVCNFLTEKKDLGVHTEMFSDGVLSLVEKGVINSKYNNLNPNKIITTYLLGTQNLYSWAHQNKMLKMMPVDYTNHPLIASQVNQLVSINSAIEVDLFGQINAEMIGPKQYSGVGGQVDFIRASRLSKGGKSIIALPSTAKKNSISRIVPNLKTGTAVTTSRHDVDYLVTEYGIADLWGKSIRERAESLINIAHPNYREMLKQNASCLLN